MSKIKIHNINLRVTNEEKTLLVQNAKKYHMSLSHYIRYKILLNTNLQQDLKELNNNDYIDSIQWLNSNYKTIARLIITGYVKISAVTDAQCSETTLQMIEKKAIKLHKKLNVIKIKNTLL